MGFKLTTATRMLLGFSIAPLGLLLLALYSLSNLATLRDQSTSIVSQEWPKIEPIMQIATGVRDNARNTRDLLLNKDNAEARAAVQVTKQRITQAMDTLGPLLHLPKGQALLASSRRTGKPMWRPLARCLSASSKARPSRPTACCIAE